MLPEEAEHLAPAIHRLFGPVERSVPIEDAVAGTVVTVELVGLAVLLEFSLVLVHLLGAWRAVVVAENADQGAGKIPREIDWRYRRLVVEFILAHHHAAAPQLGAGIDVFFLTCIDECVPATRAGAEQADLAIVVGLGAHPLHCGL